MGNGFPKMDPADGGEVTQIGQRGDGFWTTSGSRILDGGRCHRLLPLVPPLPPIPVERWRFPLDEQVAMPPAVAWYAPFGSCRLGRAA
jgi:hypothetical protein